MHVIWTPHTHNAKINRLAEIMNEKDGVREGERQRNEAIKNYCPFHIVHGHYKKMYTYKSKDRGTSTAKTIQQS